MSAEIPLRKTRRKRTGVRYVPLIGIDTRYLLYLKPFTGLLTASLMLIILVAFMEILAPWPLKYIIDNVLGGKSFNDPIGFYLARIFGSDQRLLTATLGLALLLITVLQGLASFAYEYMIGIIQARATLGLRSGVFRHVQSLPLQFFEQSRIGDLLKRVTEDASRIMVALVGSMGEFTVNAFKFIGFAAVMLFVNWRFSIIVLAYVPLMMFLYLTFRQNIRSTARAARQQEGEMMNLTLETLGAIREVKAFGREQEQQNQFDSHGEGLVRSALKSIQWEASFSPVIDFVQAGSTAAVIWYGVAQVLLGQFSVGELLIFMSYLKDMYRPLRRFSKLAATLQKAAASGDRLGKVLDVEVTIRDRPDAVPLKRARGRLQFAQVDFAYPLAPEQPVLQGFNLDIQAGQVVALVGSTGAGKSTITNLMLRFYEPTRGVVRLDGRDIRNIRLSDLRRQFAVVPQESVLFAFSVRENIAYGNPEADDAQVLAAAKAANAHEFIVNLPHGYDTVMGERGATLSGGQRQRIAIARALLRNAPILLLDEPTAALDAEAEERVMSALERLMHHRTTLIIAHRFSTIRKADLIVVLEKGHIIEKGCHDELMQKNGRYARLIRLQSFDDVALRPPNPVRPERT